MILLPLIYRALCARPSKPLKSLTRCLNIPVARGWEPKCILGRNHRVLWMISLRSFRAPRIALRLICSSFPLQYRSRSVTTTSMKGFKIVIVLCYPGAAFLFSFLFPHKCLTRSVALYMPTTIRHRVQCTLLLAITKMT